MAYYIGIDCGTQGTKVVVYDPVTKRLLGDGYGGHEIFSNETGGREQEPAWWINALDLAMGEALKNLSSGERKKIAGIGVSGQQHGLVVLDKDKKVLRRAKLWNDTETAGANQRYIDLAGGPAGVIAAIGTSLPVGYTVSKLIWLKEAEPETFEKIAWVINPKDYINFYLSGIIVTDAGSASGTGYYDVINKAWSDKMVSLIAPDFKKTLPPVIDDLDAVGKVRPEIAEKYGLAGSCIVAPGSGDNMMAAVGTGNVEPGIATMNLGTSGVFSVFTGRRPENYPEIIQIQNSIPNGWIPTICIMNATSTTTAVQELFGLELAAFDADMAASPIGAGGVIMLPFFNGERMPGLPSARGCIGGLTIKNFTRPNCIRSGAEAVAFGIRWGCDLLREKGLSFHQLRLVGGGSNSAPWRQIIADVFDAEIIGIRGKEAGAFGGIIQAMSICKEGSVPEICEKHIILDEKKRALPDPEHVKQYEGIYQAYLNLRKEVYHQ
ncbi:MAG: xylulokinase [Spirochaetaceae bacterium]|jgi:xylulokinase|nr:xylulokinase [Spirochaetaceae bacterium]